LARQYCWPPLRLCFRNSHKIRGRDRRRVAFVVEPMDQEDHLMVLDRGDLEAPAKVSDRADPEDPGDLRKALDLSVHSAEI
jgi:hypothetical protein